MIKLDSDSMLLISIFEKRTNATVKDCIVNGHDVTIIVKEGDMGQAIGKKGTIINKIESELGKEIHVYEHSSNPEKFISNLLFPVKVEKVEVNGKSVKVYIDKAEKKRAIGKGGKKINHVRELVKRHFGIDELKVM